MAKFDFKTPQPGDRSAHRVPYAAPMLKEFGPVSALTQAGTTGMGEMGMNACTSMGQVDKMC